MSTIDEAELLDRVPKQLLIGGSWSAASSGKTFEVEDPALARPIAQVADAGAPDALAAMDAAVAAQPSWAASAPRERGEILRRAFEALSARREEFALLITLEMGKPLSEARGEVAYGGEFLRWFSEEAARSFGRYSTAPDGRARLLVTKKPVGPCLLITPWNFPLAMATRKIAPAIAAGCTMVLKPSELTPLTAALFATVLEEAGVPPGVLNVIQTTTADDTIAPLFHHAGLRKISFTGSTPVGRKLLARASERVLRSSMELGGNAPFILFDDADLDAAVDGAMIAKMRNMGEACTAANRFIVHASLADRFTERLAARMAALRTGRGTEEGCEVGPMIDARSLAKIETLVDGAIAGGAVAVTGGRREDRDGYFFVPTVLRDVRADARILQEEIFGPVAPITVFDSEDEAIALANATDYGLVAYVYTRDLNRALRMGERLETGMLGLNAGAVSNPAAPFGGVKQSGLGREGGLEGIEEYLSTQYVGIADPRIAAA